MQADREVCGACVGYCVVCGRAAVMCVWRGDVWVVLGMACRAVADDLWVALCVMHAVIRERVVSAERVESGGGECVLTGMVMT